MAVDNPVLYNDYWVYLRFSMGSTHLNPSEKQVHNAELIYNNLINQGYTSQAAAGIIGNMQTESGLSPGALDGHLSTLPNNGQHLTDLTNYVMLGYASPNDSGYGTGLIQWDSYTNTAPAGNTLVSFCIRYGYEWYDGDGQLYRLQREYETDSTYHYWYSNNHSPAITWDQFKSFTGTPEEAADIFRQCRLRSSGDATGNQNRRDNARFWYEYFEGTGPVPDEWISGESFARLALQYNGHYIPYSQADCIEFVNMVWKEINQLTANLNLTLGTNSIWRSTRVFPTTDPYGTTPTNELWYKGTIEECIDLFDEIPPGSLLFHKVSEAGPPPIPPEYAGDGIGNFVHVGIYCGNNEVMQSGGKDAGSIPGGGVHKSVYDPTAWNYVAFVVYVDPLGYDPGPEPENELEKILILWHNNKQKGVVKNVRKYY